MTKIRRLFLPLLSLMPLLTAHADVYRCKDSSGRLITSDRPVAECADKTTQVYTNGGVLKAQLSGALTLEQRRAADLEEQQRAKQAQQQDQDQKELRYLTAHYPTEQDVEIARQRELDVVNTKIAEEQKSLGIATEALKRAQNEQKLIPAQQSNTLIEVKNKADELTQTIQQSERLIQRYLTEKSTINRRFDETHKRYLEVVVSNTN